MKYVDYFFLFLIMLIPFDAQAQDDNAEGIQALYGGKSTDEIIKDGLRLYSEGRTDANKFYEAINVFEYVLTVDPNQTILYYNIARSYHMLGNCEKALNQYLLYESIAAGSDDYSDVSTYIEALTKQCGQQGIVTISCAQDGVMVSFDGERKEACSGIHHIKAGSHRLVASKEGFLDYTIDFELEVDQLSEIVIKLSKDKKYHADEQVILQPESVARPLWISGVVTTSVGTAAIVAGSIVASMDYAKDNKGNDVSNTLITGVTLGGVGGLSLIAGVVLLIVDAAQADTREEEKLKQYHESLSISPLLSINESGAAAAVNFTF